VIHLLRVVQILVHGSGFEFQDQMIDFVTDIIWGVYLLAGVYH
jgi:hypothetical protein